MYDLGWLRPRGQVWAPGSSWPLGYMPSCRPQRSGRRSHKVRLYPKHVVRPPQRCCYGLPHTDSVDPTNTLVALRAFAKVQAKFP